MGDLSAADVLAMTRNDNGGFLNEYIGEIRRN